MLCGKEEKRCALEKLPKEQKEGDFNIETIFKNAHRLLLLPKR